VGAQASYGCDAIPDSCRSTPTCACIAGGSGSCQESGAGQVTLTRYAP
jgi:hypothetical protein